MLPANLEQRTLVVFPTYACTANCVGCGTYSSPRDKNVLDPRFIFTAIDEAARLGFKQLVLSGGEATLQWDTCLAAIRKASGLGLLTRLVTNGHWAASAEVADAKIEMLRAAGLNELNLSTGDEHIRFVPLANVARAAAAALSASLNVAVMIELHAHARFSRADLDDLLAPEIRQRLRYVESPWMPMDFRLVSNQSRDKLIDRGNVAATQGCDSVLSSFVVAADGRIGACCGLGMRATPELQVGSVREGDTLRSAVTQAEEDFLKLWLAVWGPHRILAWASQFDPSIEWEGRFAHKCHACMALYKDSKVRSVIEAHSTDAIVAVSSELLSQRIVEKALVDTW